MKEHPILFSTEMVKAILDGCKSITRRVVTKNNSTIGEGGDWDKLDWKGEEIYTEKCTSPHCDHVHKWKANPPYKDTGFGKGEYLHVPYNWGKDCTVYRVYSKWEIGDKLWVKETHYILGHWVKREFPLINKTHWEFKEEVYNEQLYSDEVPDYIQIDRSKRGWFKRPSIFMPRRYSRITLEITNIKAERVQEICLADIQAEGIYDDRRTHNAPIQIGKFKALWDSINAKRGYPFDSNPWVWVISFKVVS